MRDSPQGAAHLVLLGGRTSFWASPLSHLRSGWEHALAPVQPCQQIPFQVTEHRVQKGEGATFLPVQVVVLSTASRSVRGGRLVTFGEFRAPSTIDSGSEESASSPSSSSPE